MKNTKISRLFAALTFVAVLALTACQTQASSSKSEKVAVEGTWVSSWGEINIITSDSVKNYMDGKTLFYEMSIDKVEEISDAAGILYGVLTTGTEYTPKDTYYAVAYKELDDKSVKLSAAGTSFKTIDEVKKAYDKIDAFTYWSECVKDE